ncbi:MAG: undecaprenyl-diphosphate phosphatase [Bacteroidales bacterium]|nr:undecaprenyl-diphosphate phosphatase [Bacteroidales bacterium]
MDTFQAIILGFVQGLTEFLPVSSSGHLSIGSAVLGVESSENLFFTVLVHVATVLSTIVILRKEIGQLFKGLFAFQKNEETLYIGKILFSMIPVLIVGLFFKDQVEEIFGSGLLLVGICLWITASLLSFSYFAKPRQKEKIGWWDAIVIGLAQAVAVLPGISRSGSTIATGLLLGNKKEAVAKFSFLMVLIPILGEAFLDVLKIMEAGTTEAVTSLPVSAMIFGFLAAFITGCLACKWMIRIVSKGKLIYFAIYCAFAGTFAILWHCFAA